MAPAGKDAINVMVRVPNTKNKKYVWDEKLIKKMRERLIQTLQKVNGLEDINENRPQIKSRDYDNLYFIGDSVHPGTGVSLVLLGSKLLCEYLK